MIAAQTDKPLIARVAAQQTLVKTVFIENESIRLVRKLHLMFNSASFSVSINFKFKNNLP